MKENNDWLIIFWVVSALLVILSLSGCCGTATFVGGLWTGRQDA